MPGRKTLPGARDVGRRLRAFRIDLGLKAPAVAAALAMSPGNYGHYEAGRNRLSVLDLPRFAAAMGVSTQALTERLQLTGPTADTEPQFARPIPLAGRISRTEDLDLPVYRSHAGRLILADPTPLDHWRIRADRTYTVQVVGDCLFGDDINDGDWLLVDQEGRVENGRIVVVRIGEETFLVKWRKENGWVHLEMSDGQFRDALVHDLDVQGVVVNVIKPAP